MKELLGAIALPIGFITAILYAVFILDRASCYNKFPQLSPEYGFISGCMIIDPKTNMRIPSNNWRVM